MDNDNTRATCPTMIQAAVNGDRTKNDLSAVPVSVEELVRDCVACVAAGAGAIHLHPRAADGSESLDAAIVDPVVAQVRDACGVPVGVTTGEWIEPDLERRLAQVREWREPDFTSVNLCEPGSIAMMRLLLEIGVGIEAGVWTVEDAEKLAESGLGNQVTRVLVEPGEMQVGGNVDAAIELVDAIHRTLDRHNITVPRLQHADGRVTWAVLEDAIKRGVDTRVGLEDTLFGADGERTSGNEALVRAAVRIRAR